MCCVLFRLQAFWISMKLGKSVVESWWGARLTTWKLFFSVVTLTRYIYIYIFFTSPVDPKISKHSLRSYWRYLDPWGRSASCSSYVHHLGYLGRGAMSRGNCLCSDWWIWKLIQTDASEMLLTDRVKAFQGRSHGWRKAGWSVRFLQLLLPPHILG